MSVKKTPETEPWRDPVLGACACSQLRRAARAVSSLYDEFLASAGLTVTQYGLLVSIARAGAIQRTQLAEQLGMERTTLTRNLRPLQRDGLIAEKAGADRRAQMLSVTPAGKRRLDKAFSRWADAQDKFIQSFGHDRLEALRGLLRDATEATPTIANQRAGYRSAGRD